MPKGTGASGTISVQSVAKTDLGLDIINRLTPDQQRAFDWMHRPFDKVAVVRKPLTDDEAKKVEQIRQAWDGLRFANIEQDKRLQFQIKLYTAAGELQFVVHSDVAPDQVRSFLVQARLGWFDHRPLRFEGNRLQFSATDGKDLFTLPLISMQMIPPPGVLCTVSEDGKLGGGTSFNISVSPDPSLQGKVAPIAMLSGGELAKKLADLAPTLRKQAKPLLIERIEVVEHPMPLFERGGVQLPEVDANGRPRLPPEMGGAPGSGRATVNPSAGS